MFWIFNIFFLLIYTFSYLRFRGGLYCAFQISRKKKRKGFKNYWWFESHFKNGAIHKAYYINKGFFLAWCFVACVTVLLGFVSFMQPVITVLIGLLGIFLIPMHLWGLVKDCQKEYGTPIIIHKRDPVINKYYSSIPEMILICLIPIFCVFVDLAIMGVI